MPEFKVQCLYWGKERMKLLNDKSPQEYHLFSVINTEIPEEYLSIPLQEDLCIIWISDHLLPKNIVKNKDYKFVLSLGEDKTANFKHKVFVSNILPGLNEKFCHNNMILKAKSYWENTVKKIGFWDNENYFYEVNKRQKTPNRVPNNSPTKTENGTNWGKIALICLPIIILVLLSFLIIRWASKRKK